MASITPIEMVASALFALAVIHTFVVKRIAAWSHHFPERSPTWHLLHFLAETEIVFGVWAAVLFVAIAAVGGSFHGAIEYIEKLNYTEPKFVLVIMVVAASKPVVTLAETMIVQAARLIPANPNVTFYSAALFLGPLLGSVITEPAAMTLLAIVLKRRFFDQDISARLAYATLGTLFVNVSVGGVLTNFAAPPVLMVAGKWGWGIAEMFGQFGWRAILSCLIASVGAAWMFRRELATLPTIAAEPSKIPVWLTALHLAFLALVVAFGHYPDVFFGVFMIFLGLVVATEEYQEPLKLKEGLLVGFFLAGLVTLGGLQEYWLRPLISSLNGPQLFFGATALTTLTDNAALTYLGSLVDGLSPQLKYALVAGAVTGGGLTVIANAPNPAGIGILQTAKVFREAGGITPLGLFAGALAPTAIAIICFWGLA